MSNYIVTSPEAWCSTAGYTAEPLSEVIYRKSYTDIVIPSKYRDLFAENIRLSSSHDSIFRSPDLWASKCTHTSAFAYLVSSKCPRSADYYVLEKDDKYFYCHNNVWLHDTLLYSSFYARLPRLSNENKKTLYDVPDPEKTLVIFSRKQFGHFLFDDLLPCIASLDHLQGVVDTVLLAYSKEWQCDVAIELMQMFHPTIKLLFVRLPEYSQKLTFSGLTLLPVFPEILFNIKSLCEMVSSTRLEGCLYLHRGGYKGDDRVTNHEQYVVRYPKQMDILIPHMHKFMYVMNTIRASSSVICEPGTLPLLAYLARSKETEVSSVFSERCLSDCPLEYFYSGWRYHLPWLELVRPIWMIPKDKKPNPFSDVGSIPQILHGLA